MSDITKHDPQEIVEPQLQKITDFLQAIGLPSDNIIAPLAERQKIGQNLGSYISELPIEVKKDARYLSKFVVGAGLGLFDYALNSVWNEVVLSLRQKAIAYGLDIFFDKAVGGPQRIAYTNEEDLAYLKDTVLLTTCEKLELITETTSKKLAHILDMRNDIGISHPTNYTINAFELLGWLQTCIQDVLRDKPSAAAIQVKSFIDNLKEWTVQIDTDTISSIEPQIQSLATHHCDSIIRTIFGIFVTPTSTAVIRKNISLIASTVWNCSSDDEKYRIGVLTEGYKNNLHKDKYALAEDFFKTVNGNTYRTLTEKQIALNNLSIQLEDAHTSWNNFYNEPPIMENILTYIEKSSDIPESVAQDLIKSVLLCRLGRNVNYCDGISPRGQQYYDQFILLLGEEWFPRIVICFATPEVQHKLLFKRGLKHAMEILDMVRANLIKDKYIETIDYMKANIPNTGRSIFNTDFKKITATFIDWSK